MNQMTMRIPSLKFFHANDSRGAATAHFELHPAHGSTDGALYVRMANQKQMDENAQFPQFDYENGVVFALNFTQVSKLLQVLRGEKEFVNRGHGINIKTKDHAYNVLFSHITNQKHGYCLEVNRWNHPDENGKVNDRRYVQIFFTTAEALGLCEALAGSMWMLAFGTGFEATSIAIARDEAKLQAEQTANETTAETTK